MEDQTQTFILAKEKAEHKSTTLSLGKLNVPKCLIIPSEIKETTKMNQEYVHFRRQDVRSL